MQDEYSEASQHRYREGMSRLGAAVNIITSTGDEGNTGFTASAVCSVTDTPPTLLVCMNRNSRSHMTFKKNGVLCVNVLSLHDEELSPIFASAGDLPMSDRFALAQWLQLSTGAPVLESAAAAFDCSVEQIIEIGTHSVFFCGVKAVYLGRNSSGLIYHGRVYHHITSEASSAHR